MIRFLSDQGAERPGAFKRTGADGNAACARRARRDQEGNMDRNEIINKRFSHAFFGYDVIEVDGFLDEIIREMDRMHNELDILELRAQASRQREESLKARIERLSEKLVQAKIPVEDELTADDAAALIEKATLEAHKNAENAETTETAPSAEESPEESTEEQPAEEPAEEPIEESAEESAEQPAEEPIEESAEESAEEPVKEQVIENAEKLENGMPKDEIEELDEMIREMNEALAGDVGSLSRKERRARKKAEKAAKKLFAGE